MPKGYYDVLNIEVLEQIEKNAYNRGKIDLINDIKGKLSVGFGIYAILDAEIEKLEKMKC